MATVQTIKVTLTLRRDTLANWQKNNPILSSGEMSYVTDLGKCKVGDGINHWANLPYFVLETDITQNAKIVIKTEESWALEDQVESQEGVIYVYTNSNPSKTISPIVKIGDGSTNIRDLPSITDDVLDKIMQHINDEDIHVTLTEKEKWDNKVSCYISEENGEILVFDK